MTFEIIFADEIDGVSPFEEFLLDLNRRAKQGNKQAKSLLRKIYFIMDLVEERGTRIGSPWTDHIKDMIWEMRPMRYRILFAADGREILILTYFLKKTEKTPPREILRAERVLERWYREKG